MSRFIHMCEPDSAQELLYVSLVNTVMQEDQRMCEPDNARGLPYSLATREGPATPSRVHK